MKNNKRKFINVVLTGDKNYANVIGVAMVSILDNLSNNTFARFFLYTQGFTHHDISKINKIKKIYPCEINIIDVEKYIKIFDFIEQKNFKNQHINKSCLYRLLMFKYLPDDVKDCFYVDSDIVIDGDISILQLPDDKIFAAVPEGFAMQNREKILEHWYKIPEYTNFVKDPLKYTHFGAGFFLANIKRAKELEIFEQIISLLKKYPAMPYADQDILNAIYGQKYQKFMYYLPPEYNVFADQDYSFIYDRLPYSNEVFQNAAKNPIVIHYAGINKPWVNTSCNLFFEKWWFYYNKSPWKIDYIKRYIDIILKEKIKKIIQNIFSLRNNGNHKVITIFGIKIKLKRKKYRSSNK